MSLHLVGYTPWEAENTTEHDYEHGTDVTVLGVIAHYYADYSSDFSTSVHYSRLFALPNGTPAYLSTGSTLTCMETGKVYRASVYSDVYYEWQLQPSTDLSDYGTKEYIEEAMSRLQPWTTITYQPSVTIQKVYTFTNPDGEAQLSVLTQPIEITSTQVSDLSTTISTALSDYYTKTEADAITGPIKTTADMARPLSEYKVMDTDTGLDLLQLPPGKYGKAQNLNTIQNRPTGLSGAFFCIVEYLNATSRRKITLYPFSESEAGKYYVNIESGTPGTWGGWHMFTNGDSFTNISIPDNANLGYTDRSDPDNPVTVAGYTTPGMYYRGTNASSIIGRPTDYYSAFTLEVQYTVGNTRYRQILKPCALVSGAQQLQWYERYYTSTGWTDWIRHEGQAISPVIPTP